MKKDDIMLEFRPADTSKELDELAKFLSRSIWPYHVNTRLTDSDARSLIVSDKSEQLLYWIVDGLEVAGLLRVLDIDDIGDGAPVLDIRIAEKWRGQGFGTQAVKWIVHSLFEQFRELHRVEANTREDNLLMQRIFAKTGFLLEGRLRQSWKRDISSDRRLAILAVCSIEWAAAIADTIVETHEWIVGKTCREAKKICDAPLTLKGQRDVPELQKLRDSAILHVFFYTGGRVSEPGRLRVRDFRLDREYWVLEMRTKGDRGNIVAIHSDCQAAIRRYLAASGHGDQPDAPLFLAARAGQNTGKPLGRVTFHELFKKYARLAGLPSSITPHSARSTFITLSLEVGVPIRDVQATVNHASVTTTETYAHTAKKHRNSASLRVSY